VDLYAELRALASAFREARIDFALGGAIALAIHGVARAPRDIDIVARPEDLDVLLAQPPIEAVFQRREEVALEAGTAWVVSRAGLMTLKLAAGRPQDLADLRRLEERGDA
jgi:hypothetical protein